MYRESLYKNSILDIWSTLILALGYHKEVTVDDLQDLNTEKLEKHLAPG